MDYTCEKARDDKVSPIGLLKNTLSKVSETGETDALFWGAERDRAFGVTGLPFFAPLAGRILNDKQIYNYLSGFSGSQLFAFGKGVTHYTAAGRQTLPAAISGRAKEIFDAVINSPGIIDEKGRHIIDLKAVLNAPHFNVNLLLGDRMDSPYPLFTTPKSTVDAFGRGAFRSGGAQQVLATRYVIYPEENGEAANRQFYLVEDGQCIFYSLDVKNNVEKARCIHSQNRTDITYITKCGLEITRTVFILPQEEGMPAATEVQRVTVKNLGIKKRALKIVLTGAFGICTPQTIVNDVVYANVVHQTELFYSGHRPVALALHNKDQNLKGEKKFVALAAGGSAGFDEFCSGLSDFIGEGTLERPDSLAVLPSKPALKSAPFFALGKYFDSVPGGTVSIDTFVGICENPAEKDYDAAKDFEKQLSVLLEKYSVAGELENSLQNITSKFGDYSSYLTLSSQDARLNAYVNNNLPFQVLYQTFVSRSFGWTQKAYRETGFREIQDIYASMNYLIAAGRAGLVKELISMWVCNIFRMGYAYHDFTWVGKEPGSCSDDQLWLVQAVYRYVSRTGDYAFLDAEFPVAGEDGKVRCLWDTLEAVLVYSGRISVGKNGLPLLDNADWNDTLRLDKNVYKGPQKEALYREQLAKKSQKYGAAWENTFTESVMNACLLKIAADEVAEMAVAAGKKDIASLARNISADINDSVRKNCWKGDYYARAMINDGREGGYTYLGAGKDGLSADVNVDGTYYLNSFSWTVLAGIADDEQIETMVGVIEKHLKVDAGLKLCTLVQYNLLGANTATNLYYPGDRENGGVFKHAAMMAATAALRAAKTVKDAGLSARLASLAEFAISKTLPFMTLENPFVTKGNPRFCTQYNNSVTGENIGPILSGTASWLTLAVYELLGIKDGADEITVDPILPRGSNGLEYSIAAGQGEITVKISGAEGLRLSDKSRILLDGKETASASAPKDGKKHRIEIVL